jgi:UDP-N-acetylmuramoyl-tripeptide--D-alanyl-D-alanine ligase
MKPDFDPARLAAWCGGRWTCLPAVPIRGASHDTREIGPGDLFVALTGEHGDGHDYVRNAFEKGAAAALVRTGWDAPPGLPCLAAPDPLAALQAMARAHRLGAGCRIVGVTGSAGKSTVKEMTAALLGSRWPTARTLGNWNNAIGLPLSLMTLAPGHHRFGVFEAGTNHPGEIAALCDVLMPEWGILTNVGPVHVEFLKDVDGVAAEKRVLLERLPRDGVAVLNRDTACFESLRRAPPCRLLTASLVDDSADLVAEALDDEAGERQRIRVRERGRVHTIRLSVPGRHNAINALLASLVAREAGLSWAEVDAVLADFAPMRMRWQVHVAGGIMIVNDAYNANPLSMEAALQTFRTTRCEGRKWLVLGEMRELGSLAADSHDAIGEAVADGPWAGLVAVGPLAARIADRACAGGFPADRVECVPDADAAACAILNRAKAGDAVLIKASRGMRLERVARALGAPAAPGGH